MFNKSKQKFCCSYIGGGGTSFLSEGLSTALQLFDDLNKLRENTNRSVTVMLSYCEVG